MGDLRSNEVTRSGDRATTASENRAAASGVRATTRRDDYLPTANWDSLRLRAALLARTRQFFVDRGFLEVETPVLSHDTVIDRHLDPIGVLLADDPRRPHVGRQLWLQTSPEFAMKRLMAAGGESIYQITRAFRGAEIGARHNPEFTMVEWYRRDDTYSAAMQLLSDLAEALLGLGPAERLSYGEAFVRYAGVDPHRASTEELVQAVRTRGISAPESLDPENRDAWLDLLLTECVEPRLGSPAPTILCDYPASQAALAVVRAEVPAVAERFELYVRGVELANGYHELRDATILRQRNVATNALRIVDGKRSLPVESRLLTAMDRGLPACCGVALGFDRVVMLAAGASTIQEVMAFPIDRA